MVIGGLQKLTLIDYPGHIAATVFTVGCNFRCPFCHNPELVSSIEYQVSSILERDFFDFLESRRGKLEGVCITGGEPAIQPDIVEFIRRIKKMGYKVKLDTNGARPDILRLLYAKKLLDYVAMDIKNSPEKYNSTTNSKVDIERIKLSVNLIRNSGVDYEFRTTAVPGLHKEEDFAKIGKWLEGAKKYVLQAFEDKGKILDPKLKKRTQGKKIDLEKIAKNIKKYFGKVEIR
ncbi:MAG: anaerobic ribonucleoside-triphosphate reductase activating protein [Candidatus Moranbacteria bacterium CG_4_10_14_3_um_filter_44_15]|nr:MAG: anaerobic ribonucleoside-triphosphate reductase activating protein [Candidatus Moranbacteria bacterium CG06_land_8_20_14_3_00_43_56]PIV83906.1 MAG: anaerobic ribonucleoside-triphosphate reductase activating protein [Candidatus Moranbacteria bacterium CG17_big_fil_post_rev_8_21_14_2_50_44_12]PIW93689.1 MAG: anaerobic ribonucleoside-triphosphate reductase activating protein [Candidatus Moranbacteria bacterium CG_4_8_14_3_um_filter_43_15]PIX90907.1 MAG: anaerobic ribonucleoside-triphosphate